MRQWLYDGLLRKLFKNSAILFSGNIVSSIIGLVSLAITARALSVEQFGYLVLITTYVLIVDNLVNFQSWQAIIKYGADTLEHNKKNDFKSLLKFGFILDIGTAVLGTLLAASAAWFIGSWIGWKDEHKLMAAAYSFTILFHISGTPIAILRLFDQFKKTSIQQVYASVFKLVGVTIAFILDAGLWGFLLVWALTDILGKILLVYYARKELITRKIPHVFLSSISGISEKFSGLWRFVWTTNLNSSIRMTIREVDIIILGVILGPASVGIFKIVKSGSKILSSIADPLYNSIYPEISRLISLGNYKDFKKLALRASWLSGILAIFILVIFVAIGDFAIEMTFGSEFNEAYIPMIIYLFSQVVWMTAYPLSAAILSFGLPHVKLYILILATLIYLPSLYLLILNFGLIGASLATVIFFCFWSLTLFLAVTVIFKKKVRLANV